MRQLRPATTKVAGLALSTQPAVALNIRKAEADSLAAKVASLAGETKTEAVILALKERLQRLQHQRQVASRQQASLVDQLDQIGLRCASRTIQDGRTADEILG
jgi:antitoxin VapB